MRFLRLTAAMAVLACMLPQPSRAAGPAVYAHRGGAALAPENTMGAFANAEALYAARGADGWLEMDSQLTSDGVPVIIHDDSLDRTTSCTGKVIATTSGQIASCDAAAHFAGPWARTERVPTAAEVFAAGKAATPNWGIMIEIKDIPGEANFDAPGMNVADALVPLMSGYPRDRLIVESFWPPALDRVKALDPTINTLLLTTSQLPGAPPGAGFLLAENAAFATARGYEISSPDEATLDFDATGVAFAHALGREVIVWTVDTAADIARAEAAGVDGIITNDPTLLL